MKVFHPSPRQRAICEMLSEISYLEERHARQMIINHADEINARINQGQDDLLIAAFLHCKYVIGFNDDHTNWILAQLNDGKMYKRELSDLSGKFTFVLQTGEDFYTGRAGPGWIGNRTEAFEFSMAEVAQEKADLFNSRASLHGLKTFYVVRKE